MHGGEISGNTATSSNSSYGGGVYVGIYNYGGSFTMNGGEISGNTATSSNSSYGGGGYVYTGYGSSFTMNGGEISGNTATSSNSNTYGGGVYVDGNGNTLTFTKSGGGIIYGNNGATNLQNKADEGYAVYWNREGSSGGPLWRNGTLYAGDDISTANTVVGWDR
jgi:hypothetical protein